MSERPWGPQAPAFVMVVLASAAFGFAPVLVRWLDAAGTAPELTVFYRFLGTAIVMLRFLSLSRPNFLATLMGLIAGAAVALGWFGFAITLRTETMATAGIAFLSYPFFTLIFAWVLTGLIPGPRSGIAAILAMVAILLTFEGGNLQMSDLERPLKALIAPASFGFATVVLGTWMTHLSPFQRMACVPIGACLALLPMVLRHPVDTIVPGNDTLAIVMALAIGAALLPQFFYTIAAPRLGPVRAAVAGSVELPVMFVCGAFFFSEAIRLPELLAGGMVMTALLFVSLSRQPHGRPPTA